MSGSRYAKGVTNRDEQTEQRGPDLAGFSDRIDAAASLPLEDRADAFLGLHDELLAELEGGDGEY